MHNSSRNGLSSRTMELSNEEHPLEAHGRDPAKFCKDALKQRSRHRDRVPVVCVDSSVAPKDAPKAIKLLVPRSMSGKDLRKTVYEKAPNPKLLMVGGVALPDYAKVLDLDKKYMDDDGFLYITRHVEEPFGSSAGPAEGTPCSDEAASKTDSHAIIHLPDQDPDDANTSMTETSKYARMIKKHPNRVPVRFTQEKDIGLGIESFDKKLLAPGSMPFSQFKHVVVCHHVPQPTCKDVEVLVNGVVLQVDADLSELYEVHKSPDGLLRMCYGQKQPLEEQDSSMQQLLQEKDSEIEQVKIDAEAEIERVRKCSVLEVTDLHLRLEETQKMRTLSQDNEVMLQCKVADLEGQIEELRADAAKKLAESEARANITNKQLADAEGTVQELQKQLDLQQSKASALNMQLAVRDEELDQVRSQCDALKTELEQRGAASTHQEAPDATSELETLRTELQQVENARNLAEVVNRSLQQTIASKDEEIANLKSEARDAELLQAQQQLAYNLCLAKIHTLEQQGSATEDDHAEDQVVRSPSNDAQNPTQDPDAAWEIVIGADL